MAHGSEQIVYHIDEQFCQCAICLKPFSEPKSLPCLHRFCKDCLSPLFENLTAGDIFSCPLCRAELSVTEGGVEDIKSDFLVSELTKVIQLQKNLQTQNQVRRCVACSKEEESEGFCSRCGGFLCQNCFNLHQTFSASMLKDHQPIIDLKDISSGKVKIGIEKLSQFTKSPRCQNHPENILRLSCVTCKGQQICLACTYEDHVEHKAESIKNMAGKQRDDLQKKIDELRLLVNDWDSNYKKVTMAREKSSAAVKEVIEKVRGITEEKLEKLKEERENNQLCTEAKVNKLQESIVLEKARLEKEKNEKIKEIERQYDEMLEKHETDTNNNIGKMREDSNKRSDETEKQTAQLKAHCDEMINAFSRKLQQQYLGLDGLMSALSNVQKRFENLITTGSSVLSLANDWSAIESIPSLSFAIDGIKVDITKVKEAFDKIVDEGNLPNPKVILSEKLGTAGFIECHKYVESLSLKKGLINFKYADQIIFFESGCCFIVSGALKVAHSAAVVKVSMTDSKYEHLKHFKDCPGKNPYCLICRIDGDVVATACDKSLVTINVKEPAQNEVVVGGEGYIICICSDRTLKQILTHQANNDIVKVFDVNLNLVKTRQHPAMSFATCMTVHDNKLIIGLSKEEDDEIYILNDRDETLSIIPSPGLQRNVGDVWNIWDVCCSSTNGRIYALWSTSEKSDSEDSRYTLVYTPSYYPLEMIRTNTCASCVTLMETDETTTVVAASSSSLYMCKLD